MVTSNIQFDLLSENYLFSEISKRMKEFQKNNPGTKIYKLGIGDTTLPLPRIIVEAMKRKCEDLAHIETYSGYGDETGHLSLRQAISKKYAKLGISLDVSEIFVSDGAKPDTANIQQIFSRGSKVAIQDPVYPVYLDSSIIHGNEVVFLSGNEENNFFPAPPDGKVDLLFICSPNNPTGVAATRESLEEYVQYALDNDAIIIYDSAYASFISEGNIPRSIYEIEGAKECAIEITSLSKEAGFTGIRLGWTIVPKEISVDGQKGKANRLWRRRQTTMFNGASIISQAGALAVFTEEGQKQCSLMIKQYLKNAKIIREALDFMDWKYYGGVNSPYVWLKTPNNLSSWDFFDLLLQKTHIVGTPGSGFGKNGEGYFRLSAFAHREDIIEATKILKQTKEELAW